MQRPILVTAPTTTPVTLAEAKSHARVDFDDDDALIASFIDAAVTHLDGRSGILGRCLITQTWRQPVCAWPANGRLRLPFPDVSSVAIKYSDEDNAEQTLSTSLYDLVEDERSAIVRFKDAFTRPTVYSDREDAIRVEVTAGYGAAGENVPTAIRQAILMLVAHFYNNREAAGERMEELPFAVSALLNPYRRVGV